jgi:hypothetical protein
LLRAWVGAGQDGGLHKGNDGGPKKRTHGSGGAGEESSLTPGSGDEVVVARTMVDFGHVRTTQNTPAIPAGGGVDLMFKAPAICFDPVCDFRILVDADRRVGKSDEGNNATEVSCAH